MMSMVHSLAVLAIWTLFKAWDGGNDANIWGVAAACSWVVWPLLMGNHRGGEGRAFLTVGALLYVPTIPVTALVCLGLLGVRFS
ncbi:MAG: hypothetical protein JWN73_1660 [Betaproteobacteria bacterium]|nr:hypothetical protein [Betaproteobacteria bacterium]